MHSPLVSTWLAPTLLIAAALPLAVPAAAEDIPIDVPPASETWNVPGLFLPATCQLDVCYDPTVIPAQSTPGVPEDCYDPLPVCFGVDPVPLTPTVTVPPVCVVAPGTCLMAAQITEPIVLTVSSPGFSGGVFDVAEFVTLAPMTVRVGPIEVTLCSNVPCLVPVVPHASLHGSLTVTVTAQGQTFTRTVPVSLATPNA